MCEINTGTVLHVLQCSYVGDCNTGVAQKTRAYPGEKTSVVVAMVVVVVVVVCDDDNNVDVRYIAPQTKYRALNAQNRKNPHKGKPHKTAVTIRKRVAP